MIDFRTTSDFRKTEFGTNPGCRYHTTFVYSDGEHRGYWTDDLAEALADYNDTADAPDLVAASIRDQSIKDEHGNSLIIYMRSEHYRVTPRMRKQLALEQRQYPEWGPAAAA